MFYTQIGVYSDITDNLPIILVGFNMCQSSITFTKITFEIQIQFLNFVSIFREQTIPNAINRQKKKITTNLFINQRLLCHTIQLSYSSQMSSFTSLKKTLTFKLTLNYLDFTMYLYIFKVPSSLHVIITVIWLSFFLRYK